jgi:metal-responsive CopG/Arc/MetJ family transcriptional regulator
MPRINQLEKKQIGLRLPKYLIEEIDEFSQIYSVNRSEIITEAIRSYVSDEKAKLAYQSFENSCQEAKEMMQGKPVQATLSELIDELKTDSNT